MKKLIYSAALVSVLMLGACGDVEEISDENVILLMSFLHVKQL